MPTVQRRARFRTRPSWPALADLACGVLVSLSLFAGTTGGFTIELLGVRLAAHNSWWLVVVAVAIAFARIAATRSAGWVFHAAIVGIFVQAVAAHYQPRVGFTDLIVFGTQFQDHALPSLQAVPHHVIEGAGYDGQFYAQLALDPLLRDPALGEALDNAGYRARRILFAWTAWAMGLGQPWWVLQAYALQNAIAWLLLAWLLLRWFPRGSPRSVALWAGCLCGEGLLGSVRSALVDGPSLVLVVLAVAAVERGRPWKASGLLGLAGLGRETSALAGVALLRPGWWRRRELPLVAAQGAAAILPLALWLAYVRWGAGFEMSAGESNFGIPLPNYVKKWTVTLSELARGGFSPYARSSRLALLSLLALVSLTTQMAYLLLRTRWLSAWWRVGAVHILLAAVMGWAVWEGFPGAFTRALLPITIAFNVCLRDERRFWPWFVLGNLTVVHGLVILKLPSIAWHL